MGNGKEVKPRSLPVRVYAADPRKICFPSPEGEKEEKDADSLSQLG